MKHATGSFHKPLLMTALLLIIFVCCSFGSEEKGKGDTHVDSASTLSVEKSHRRLSVFTPYREDDALLIRKQRQDLSTLDFIDFVSNTTEQQRAFMQTAPCVEGAAERYTALTDANQLPLAEELWKYCSLYVNGGMYLDSASSLLRIEALQQLLTSTSNAAVLTDSFAPRAIHGSLLLLKDAKLAISRDMAKLLVETSISTLEASPLLLPQALYSMIFPKNITLGSGQNEPWYLLHQACSVNPFRRQLHGSGNVFSNSPHQCPKESGFCCFVYIGDNEESKQAILASKSPIVPTSTIFYNKLSRPFQSTASNGMIEEELPFISTLKRNDAGKDMVAESPTEKQQHVPTFYEQMKDKRCLPSSGCGRCLGDKKRGATCVTCLEACPCYCRALCQKGTAVAATVSANLTATFHDFVISRPRHARDPTRLIPRIIHQTWFEDLTKEKYPNMSRMTQSFEMSGWEYNFYTDDQAAAFLKEHFPPQVLEAYESLIPGAFKADLFRYCVLLIRGGVYADVDTLLGPSLDAAIPGDVGFMVPLDEPGKRVGKRMCLWNGFIAAAPGHPFLSKAIETVVNNILQRFTSVDMAQMHCPEPEMSVITSFSPLFVAGPCMLGGTINRVLGRHGQTSFEAGELAHLDYKEIPGRTIILDQNKWDMGAHRFTFVEKNLVVLSTDFPDSDDRDKLDDYEHYSTTRIKFEIYGIDSVYKDQYRSTDGLLRLRVE